MTMTNHRGLLRAVATTALMLVTYSKAALAESGSVVIPLNQVKMVPVAPRGNAAD